MGTMFCLDDCVGFRARKSARTLSETLEDRLTNIHITTTQWTVLYYINLNTEISQKRLSDLLSLKESSIARQIDKLESLGWVIRKQSELDKRNKLLILTESGKEMEKMGGELVDEFKKELLRGIDQGDLMIFRDVLIKMVENIK